MNSESKYNSEGFVAVHIGAGYHSPANCELYEDVCKKACLQAIQLLREKKSALEAVIAATISLEDSEWTNAGLGSNLTLDGTVECDASLMDGASLQYGAVGAVSGVKNPIKIAESLLITQMAGEMSLGRIPPSTLVGQGAYKWATKHGLPTVKKEDLITDSSRKTYIKNKRKLEMFNEEINNSRLNESLFKKISSEPILINGSDDPPVDIMQDTVGAICVDYMGRIASAVSSGGIILKQSGRLGQAALYGCGCWAENDLSGSVGIGVSTSGCGEQLSKTILAKTCAESLKSTDDSVKALTKCFRENFLESPFLKNEKRPLGGALVVTVDVGSEDKQKDINVLWAHTTDSMCLAFMSTNDLQPQALVSRLPEGSHPGKTVFVQNKSHVISNHK